MNNNDINFEQVILFLKSHWKPIGFVSVIMIVLIITLAIPSKDKKTVSTDPSGRVTNKKNPDNNNNSTKRSFNPLGFLFDAKKDQAKTKESSQASLKTPPNIVTEQTSQSTITQIQPNGTKSTQKVTAATTINTIQGTINPNTNVSGDITTNAQLDNIRIVFQNPDGSTFTYIPPGTPPDDIRWARYTNNIGKYAINYPYNWQFVYSIIDGHEGVALYPPGVDVNNPTSPYIGFGITNSFHLPTGDDASKVFKTSIIADGIPGDLYTNGPLGNSYIASVFLYNSDFFGLGGSKSDATFAYVYYFMIKSLTFNIE